MTRRDAMMCDLLKNILWILLIVYVATIWRIDSTEPTIIYNIELPQEVTEPIEPAKPSLPDESVATIEPRYGFTEDEIYLMAVLLSGSKYADGDGEYDIDFANQDDNEQIALVLSVVMNRIRSDQFPNTVEEIIWASGQFAPMTQWVNGLPEVSDIALHKVRLWCETYDAYNPYCQTIPDSHLYFYGNGTINISRERWYS